MTDQEYDQAFSEFAWAHLPRNPGCERRGFLLCGTVWPLNSRGDTRTVFTSLYCHRCLEENMAGQLRAILTM